MLIDTHCHLASSKFSPDEIEDIVRRAEQAGVSRIIAIGTDLEDSEKSIALAERYDAVFATVGIHPTEVLDLPSGGGWLAELRQLLQHPKAVAIGEIGLDYFHPPERGSEEAYRALQFEVFRLQLELAAELNYNVVVHQRDCFDETSASIAPFDGKLRGVFHCFTGTKEQAAGLAGRGHLVSFTGIVTFKNAADVHECAKSVQEGRFMVETDAPYLAPVPFRGKRCEPSYTKETAACIADLRGVSLDELAMETTATAETFFRFSP